MPAAQEISRRALGRATLARQLLLERTRSPVVDAVARLAGLQAQEPAPPLMGLWSRLEDFEAGELEQALERRRVVRATSMRGTLHLLAAADYARLWSAIAGALQGDMARYLARRLEGVDVEALVEDGRALFDDADALSAKELRERLAKLHPEADTRAIAAVVRTSLPLVRVPDGGRHGFTPKAPFTDAERFTGRRLRKRPDSAELVRRYLGAFGPAGVRDAQTWLGGGALGPVFDKLRPELRVFREEGGRTELFDLREAPRPPEDTPAPVRLLPEFDSLLLAHADRRRVISDEHRRVLTTKNLRVRATLLVDGRVAGFWRLESKRSQASVAIEPLVRLKAADRRAALEEGERLAHFAAPEAKGHGAVVS